MQTFVWSLVFASFLEFLEMSGICVVGYTWLRHFGNMLATKLLRCRRNALAVLTFRRKYPVFGSAQIIYLLYAFCRLWSAIVGFYSCKFSRCFICFFNVIVDSFVLFLILFFHIILLLSASVRCTNFLDWLNEWMNIVRWNDVRQWCPMVHWIKFRWKRSLPPPWFTTTFHRSCRSLHVDYSPWKHTFLRTHRIGYWLPPFPQQWWSAWLMPPSEIV